MFTTIEIELAHSLPILKEDKEIVFFYEERENQEHERVIEDIKYIAYKRIIDGKEFKYRANEVVPVEIIDGIKGTKLSSDLSIEEELDVEDYYIGVYEKAYSNVVKTNSTKEELNNLFYVLKTTLNSNPIFGFYEFLYNYTFTE